MRKAAMAGIIAALTLGVAASGTTNADQMMRVDHGHWVSTQHVEKVLETVPPGQVDQLRGDPVGDVCVAYLRDGTEQRVDYPCSTLAYWINQAVLKRETPVGIEAFSALERAASGTLEEAEVRMSVQPVYQKDTE